MLALDSGYPYKRSHLVVRRPTKISAMDPPCRLKACPVYPESRHQTGRPACRLSGKSGRGPLFDHLVGASEQPRGNLNAERLGRLEVNR
jgi:hypothetical protein